MFQLGEVFGPRSTVPLERLLSLRERDVPFVRAVDRHVFLGGAESLGYGGEGVHERRLELGLELIPSLV